MKPIILYEPSEINFVSNGIGVLSEATSAVVVEERNSIYELTITYPVTGKLYPQLAYSCIIKCPVNASGKYNLFRIYSISKPMNGLIVIKAEHISYQLSYTALAPFTATSAAEAMYKIGANVMSPCPFTFWTDKEVTANYNQVAPDNVRIRLGGTSGSILDVYGGEYEFDDYTVKLHTNRGQNRNVTLRYGKNITDIEQEENIESVYTSIVGFWRNEDDVISTSVIDSQYVNSYPFKRTMVVDFSSDYQEKPTLAQLTTKATSYMNSNDFGIPKVSIKVSFVALWQTEEYKNVAPLEQVYLCDTVSVYFEKLGITAQAKVVKTQFNVLLNKYDSIELGSARTNLSNRLAEQTNEVQKTIVDTKSELEKSIDRATQLITGNRGGYVVTRMDANGKPTELLIMDTDNVETAQKVWRYNNAGWGFSSTGINGQYRLAATQDGHLVADFIDTGTLNANIVKAGVLGDVAGKNYWNMVTGEFSLSGNTLINNDQSLQHILDGFQDQIDGNVTTWFYSGVPTLNNLPASDWTTTTEKDAHLGDLYYDSVTEYAYRFMKSNGVYSWEHLSDSDISAALGVVQGAQDTADHKRRVFVTQPVPPYDEGDLWCVGTNGDILTCVNTRTTGSYVAADWEKRNKYTDDSALTNFLTNTYAADKTSIQNQIDGKAETWYQSTDPATAWTTADQKAAHVGDLWYKTSNSTTWYYQYDSSTQTYSWVEQEAPDEVFDKIDGKAQVFVGTSYPTPPYNVGDLWFIGSGYDIYTCDHARTASEQYAATDWKKKNKYIDLTAAANQVSTALTAYDNNLDQVNVFNKLTDNGTVQGIFMQYGPDPIDPTVGSWQLYINAEYIATGILADHAGKFSLNMTTGALSMKDGSFTGTITGSTIQTKEAQTNNQDNARIVMDTSSSIKGYLGSTMHNLINMEQEVSQQHQMTIDADTQLNIRTPSLCVTNVSGGTGVAQVYETVNQNKLDFVTAVSKNTTRDDCVEQWVGEAYCILPVYLNVSTRKQDVKLGMLLTGATSESAVI